MFGTHEAAVAHAAISSDERLLVSSAYDGKVKVFRLGAKTIKEEWQGDLPQSGPRVGPIMLGDESSENWPATYVARWVYVPANGYFIGATEHNSVYEYEIGPPIPHLWKFDPRTRAFEGMRSGHSKGISALAVVPGGSDVIVGGRDGGIRVVDAESGASTRLFQLAVSTYNEPVSDLCVTSNGCQLMTVSHSSGPIFVFDLKEKVLKRLGDSSDFAQRLAVSDDGKYLAVGATTTYSESLSGLQESSNSGTKLWDLVRGEVIFTVPQQNKVSAMAFLPKTHVLAVGSSPRELRLWQVASQSNTTAATASAPSCKGPVRRVEFHPSNRTILASTAAAVHLFDADSGERLRQFNHDRESQGLRLRGAAFSKDGGTVFALISDEKRTLVRALDAVTAEHTRDFADLDESKTHVSLLQSLNASPDGKLLLANGLYSGELEMSADGGEINQALVAWSAETGKVAKIVPFPTKHTIPFADHWLLVTSKDSRVIVVTTIADDLRLFEPDHGFRSSSIGKTPGWIAGIVILEDLRVVVVAGNDEAISAWSMSDGELVWKWDHVGKVTAMASSPSGHYLVFGKLGGEIQLVRTGAKLNEVASFAAESQIESVSTHTVLPLVAAGDHSGPYSHLFRGELPRLVMYLITPNCRITGFTPMTAFDGCWSYAIVTRLHLRLRRGE